MESESERICAAAGGTKSEAGIGEHTGILMESEAWGAVLDRDRRFDGLFVYAVHTTGIYCRPSCPARKPRRENVSFIPTAGQAETAGYRPCLRCRPDQVTGLAGEKAVKHARAYLDDHPDDHVTLEELASHTNISPSHLQKTFKRIVGLSPKKYQNARRLERFKDTVSDDKGVLEATYEAGFGSSRALYEQAKDSLGMTPGTYRRGGEGMEIRYTTLDSAFGRVLVAATKHGVCSVSLGEYDATLQDSLEAEFFNAAVVRDDESILAWARPIVRYLEGAQNQPNVPIDTQGTDFQRQVWKVLQEIPVGETRSYGDVARILGRPTAARAVARACATNNLAVIIPCHRVVRSDGAIGGYRWGTERKERLLCHERVHALDLQLAPANTPEDE